MSKHPIAFTLPAALLAAFIAVWPAAAQSPAGVFAGKTVNMIIGFGTGGGYDLWARLVARHIGRHLPGNPTVTPQNMEGAGSYRAANFIYNVAPRDGTSIALIARDAPLGPLIGPGAQQHVRIAQDRRLHHAWRHVDWKAELPEHFAARRLVALTPRLGKG